MSREKFIDSCLKVMKRIEDGELADVYEDKQYQCYAFEAFNELWRGNNFQNQQLVTPYQYSILDEFWYILEGSDVSPDSTYDIKWEDVRKAAGELSFIKLTNILGIKNYHEENLKFVLKNWCVLLLADEKELRRNSKLQKLLKKFFELKANGNEEDYIAELQRAMELRKFIERIVKENISIIDL